MDCNVGTLRNCYVYEFWNSKNECIQSTNGTFWIFAALMGASLASIFVVYTQMSIARVFFITAGTFGAMSIYGYTTKRDLTKLGSFLMMGLIRNNNCINS